jgi:dihydrofolate reductase/thymidylate synthase
MSLARFSIIVAIDSSSGIAKEGDIPWNLKSDMQFFKELTTGGKNNAVIMGRVTYESIPEENRPLKDRHNVVISRTMTNDYRSGITVYSSIMEALEGLGQQHTKYDDIFIIGGEQIYHEVIRDYLYLCNHIYVTRIKTNYSCDQFFPWDTVKDFTQPKNPVVSREYTRHIFSPNIGHAEYQYLDWIQDILDRGDDMPDRTGVGTKSIFGEVMMNFDISERLPILTTRKIHHDKAIRELLFFISGQTNTKLLEEQGVNYWKGNTSREFLDSRGLTDLEEGDLGPGYGFQWRYYGAEYKGCHEDYTSQGLDQLQYLIEQIRDDPHSRRHILTAWNPAQNHLMALPACHMTCQFNVSPDNKYIDCVLMQRSGDMFLGVPYNIMQYSLLTYMIGRITGLKPRKFTHVINNAHIYNNHIQAANKLLKRTPRPFPKLSFRAMGKVKDIDDYTFENFVVEGYTSWPHIKAEMAV